MISYKALKNTLWSNDMLPDELAEKVGVSGNIIRRYISGGANPSLEILDRITDALDCEICDVVRYYHVDSVDNKVKRYEEELRTRFVSVPTELDDFIKKMVEAYRKGLEE